MTSPKPNKRSRKQNDDDVILIPQAKQFIAEMGNRYYRVLTIIDEALNSENFREKIWAAELILKRLSLNLPLEKENIETMTKKKSSTLNSKDLANMTPQQITQAIQRFMRPKKE